MRARAAKSQRLARDDQPMSAVPRATERWESELPMLRLSQQRPARERRRSSCPMRTNPDTLVWASIAASTRSMAETWMGLPSTVAPSPRAAA